MAEVFLANRLGDDDVPEKLVAIKRVLPQLSADQEFVGRLATEARLMAAIDHPNVVKVFEFGEMGEQYFIAMEFVHGEDLRTVRAKLEERGQRASLAFACRVVADLLAGLHCAHQQCDRDGKRLGLVHRDVSPANVLVGYDGRVKLVDFGIAKSSLFMTEALQLKGKFAYMSPEQVQLRPVDARSDVFAAGVILWELCHGGPLFKRDSVEATIRAVLDGEVPALCREDESVPARLDAILERALARKPEERYASAEAMREDLERLIAGQRWEAGGKWTSNAMRVLFADKIEQQEADVKAAGRSDVFDYLMWMPNDVAIVWIERPTVEEETETGEHPLPPTPSQVTDETFVEDTSLSTLLPEVLTEPGIRKEAGERAAPPAVERNEARTVQLKSDQFFELTPAPKRRVHKRWRVPILLGAAALAVGLGRLGPELFSARPPAKMAWVQIASDSDAVVNLDDETLVRGSNLSLAVTSGERHRLLIQTASARQQIEVPPLRPGETKIVRVR